MRGFSELENKIGFAYCVDLGIMDYSYAFDLQVRFAKLRKENKICDIIFCVQHNPVISFGAAKKHNGFSQQFLEEVRNRFGNDDLSNVIEYLKQQGIQFYDAGSGFNGATRGGGSTYIGPGQLVVYPVVDYKKILKLKDSLGISEYKTVIDNIMLDVLHEYYNIGAKAFKVTDILPDEDRRDRKDIWIEKKNRFYKIGSKGIHFSDNIAHHGFSIFVNKEGIKGFDKILVCGYTKDQLDVTSMEHEIGENIDIDEVKRLVINKVQKYFGYDDIIETTLDQIRERDGI